MPLKILANDKIAPDAIALLKEKGFEVDEDKILQEELAEKIQPYHGIIVRSATKVTAEVLEAASNLEVVARAGVGLDNIDLAVAVQKGIKVINTPMASSRAVAELAIAQIYTLSRNLHRSNREMPTKGRTEFKKLKKRYSSSCQVQGKTLGIIGMGNIGKKLAALALGNGMKVLPVDHSNQKIEFNIKIEANTEVQVPIAMQIIPKDEMLQRADFISIHAPFKGGKAILGEDEFAKMKDGMYIINAARGGVVDEEALLRALESGTVSAAALDVFEDEPSPKEAILKHPAISLSPHIGGSTPEAQAMIGTELVEKIEAHFAQTGVL